LVGPKAWVSRAPDTGDIIRPPNVHFDAVEFEGCVAEVVSVMPVSKPEKS
jgi:hypothetical protein